MNVLPKIQVVVSLLLHRLDIAKTKQSESPKLASLIKPFDMFFSSGWGHQVRLGGYRLKSGHTHPNVQLCLKSVATNPRTTHNQQRFSSLQSSKMYMWSFIPLSSWILCQIFLVIIIIVLGAHTTDYRLLALPEYSCPCYRTAIRLFFLFANQKTWLRFTEAELLLFHHICRGKHFWSPAGWKSADFTTHQAGLWLQQLHRPTLVPAPTQRSGSGRSPSWLQTQLDNTGRITLTLVNVNSRKWKATVLGLFFKLRFCRCCMAPEGASLNRWLLFLPRSACTKPEKWRTFAQN